MTQKKQQRESCSIEADIGDRPRLRLSVEANCLSEASVLEAKKAKQLHVKRKHCDVFGNVTERVFLPVFFMDGKQFADVKTGSLYDFDDGRCLTGAARLVDDETPIGLRRLQIETQTPNFNNKRRNRQRAA